MSITTIRVKTRVPESRQVLLTLPPDCQVGEAELEVVVRQDDPPAPQAESVILPEVPSTTLSPRRTHPKLVAELAAFSRLLPELLSQYRGRYVALHEGAILAVGDTEIEALNLAYSQQPKALVLVRKVTDQPEPIERLPFFRPVDGA